jgi:hypothetical protein
MDLSEITRFNLSRDIANSARSRARGLDVTEWYLTLRGLLSIPAYAGYRLSEQSVHAWDIEVALDPAATIPAPEAELLWERLDLVASRFRDADVLKTARAEAIRGRAGRPGPDCASGIG